MEWELFETHRSYLFAIAYRMLGSVMEAEDMVQETYLRLDRSRPEEIRAPKAYLAKIVTRLCLDQLKSAAAQREEYIGPWLPEPLMTQSLPEVVAVHRDSLSTAYLFMLEYLSPEERAVYILREAFEFDYRSVADVLQKEEPACRKLFSRAKKRLGNLPQSSPMKREEKEGLVVRFLEAWYAQDVDRMVTLLAEDIVQYSDGGGKAHSVKRPIHGHDHVTRFLISIMRMAPENLGLQFVEANGDICLIATRNDEVFIAYQFEFGEGVVKKIFAVLNPDKLKNLNKNG